MKLRVMVVVAAVAAVFAPGCESVDTDMSIQVMGYLSLPDIDTVIYYSHSVRIFAHYADTALYTVTSYEDAATGTITDRLDGTKQRPFAEGHYNGETQLIEIGPFTHGPVMLVAYDEEDHTEKYGSKMYGWRQVDVEAGIANIRVPVIFIPENRVDSLEYEINGVEYKWYTYTNSRWTIANDNPYVQSSGDEDEGEDDDEDENDDEDGESGSDGGDGSGDDSGR